ncbi:NAD(P)-binding protein [Peniophora sp. CONT]|nr:NAD(P)-binding protein [Peniophora sp. CONT]
MVQNHAECSIFSPQHDVYPLIDPEPHFASKTFKDKVVILTGGSTGIGAVTALFYAKAGARVTIVARRADRLEERKIAIEKEVPGAQILTVAGDISDPEVGKRVVKATVDKWKQLDIVISNSAVMNGGIPKFAEKDLSAWWYTQEVNVRGTLNIIHAAIPELLKTRGQIIVVTSDLAHSRVPLLADYCVSKHTIDRFVEILAIEYPSLLTVYSVHPGVIATDGALEFQESLGIKGKVPTPDTVELPAATFLWLTAPNSGVEFLSGRYIQATWDLNEVLAKKEEIIRDNLLVTKLAGPAKSA